MRATETITLHNNEFIIAEVFEGEEYNIPQGGVYVFPGTLEECKTTHPELKDINEITDNTDTIL